MPTNTAAWLVEHDTPLEVKPADYTSPAENEIVIKNGAVAINPVDWVLQAMGTKLIPTLKYPGVLGGDVAGEVVEVGKSASRFSVGDRVCGMSLGLVSSKPAEGAFQAYTIVSEILATPIPDSMSYEDASVLPLCLSTAACGLFQKNCLALQLPSIDPKPTGKTILVWGGASSVGCNGIQLGVAAGYEVVTTASLKNTEYLKKLGASQVLDYNSPTVVDDLTSLLKDRDFAGALNTARGPSQQRCMDVVAKSSGRKFVASAAQLEEPLPEGIEAKFYFGNDIRDTEVGPAVFRDFMPKALEQGKFVAAPEALVVGKGLESVQEAFEVQKKGVSMKKVVVSL